MLSLKPLSLTFLALIVLSLIILDGQFSSAQFIISPRIRRPIERNIQRLIKEIEELDFSGTRLSRLNHFKVNNNHNELNAITSTRDMAQGRMVVGSQRNSPPALGGPHDRDSHSADKTTNRKSLESNTEITCHECGIVRRARHNHEKKDVGGEKQINLSKLVDHLYLRRIEKICADLQCNLFD